MYFVNITPSALGLGRIPYDFPEENRPHFILQPFCPRSKRLHLDGRRIFHEGVQVPQSGNARLDMLHVNLHALLELAHVLRADILLDLRQRILQGLQLIRTPEEEGKNI